MTSTYSSTVWTRTSLNLVFGLPSIHIIFVTTCVGGVVTNTERACSTGKSLSGYLFERCSQLVHRAEDSNPPILKHMSDNHWTTIYENSDEIVIQNLARPSHPLPSPVRINWCVWLQAYATSSKLDNDTSNIARILKIRSVIKG